MKFGYPFFIVASVMRYRAMAIFPFIILREKKFSDDPIIMNHEMIHHRQQIELLIFPFYFFYLFNYAINRLKFKTHYEAYRNIIFEREAFSNDSDLNYLKKRKWFSFLKYT